MTVSHSLSINLAVLTLFLAGGQPRKVNAARLRSTDPYPGTCPTPLLRQSRAEQATDLRSAIGGQTAAIRRLFAEQARINAEAD